MSLALRRRQGEVEISGTLIEGATPRCDAQIGASLMRMFDIDVGDATANTATRSEEYSQAANQSDPRHIGLQPKRSVRVRADKIAPEDAVRPS